MRTFHLFSSIFAFAICWQLYGQVSYTRGKDSACGARIALEAKNSMITATGYYKNSSNQVVTYNYELVVIKNSNSNHSNNTQYGIVSVEPGVEKLLSISKINYSDNDVLEFELHIMNDGKIICSQQSVYSTY